MAIAPSEFAQAMGGPHGGWYALCVIAPVLVGAIVAQFLRNEKRREKREREIDKARIAREAEVTAERQRERERVQKLWFDREEELRSEREHLESEHKQEREAWGQVELGLVRKVEEAINAHLETLRAGPQIEHLTKLANLLLETSRKGLRDDSGDGG